MPEKACSGTRIQVTRCACKAAALLLAARRIFTGRKFFHEFLRLTGGKGQGELFDTIFNLKFFA